MSPLLQRNPEKTPYTKVYSGALPCLFCTEPRADGRSIAPKPVWHQRLLGKVGLLPVCPGPVGLGSILEITNERAESSVTAHMRRETTEHCPGGVLELPIVTEYLRSVEVRNKPITDIDFQQ